MRSLWCCLLIVATAQSVSAASDEGPYYGPMQRWHGIGYKFGYEDHVESDGTWRTDASVHTHGDATNMALYRTAERARSAGYRYVVFLGGRWSKSPGVDEVKIYARPSLEPVAPSGCRSKQVAGCYTADVAEVLRILGGPNGTQPGMPITDHSDRDGRGVTYSGYGVGAVATLLPVGTHGGPIATIVDGGLRIRGKIADSERATSYPTVATPLPARADAPTLTVASPIAAAPRPPVLSGPDTRFDAALKAAQPVRRREPTLGWTVSD